MKNERLLAVGLSTALLAGCANLQDLKPGTPYAEAQKEFGQPTTVCVLNDGGQRVVWSQQPMGHYAWGTTVAANGRVGAVTQVLTDASFQQLAQGVWTPERVQCEFGPPESIGKVGLPSNLQVVWSYRYRQDGVWYSLMYVFFGADGKQVTKFFAGPDPLFMFDDRFYW
jgi:hypothetical protein